MKREFISAFRSEVWLLARHPATALMIALAAVLYVVAAATSSEVLIMVAGDDPYTLGGAIGFIGNLVDAGDVLGSVARTSFASTVVWIPVTILYAVYATSRDFESVAYAVSRSRGVSQAAIVITKLLVNCTLVGAVYLLSTTALYLTKMAQWDVGASCSGFAQFVSIALMIALLLISMYAATFALYLLTRSVVASSVVAIAVSTFVMVWFPSTYGSGQPSLLLMLSPVYYLMNLCSLSMQNVGVIQVLLYAGGTVLVSVGVALVSLFDESWDVGQGGTVPRKENETRRDNSADVFGHRGDLCVCRVRRMGLRRGRGPVLWLFRRSGLSFLDRGWANGYLFLAKCRLHGAYGVLPNRLCCCGGDAIR